MTQRYESRRTDVKVGDVVQINENHGRNGWIGAFVLVTEMKAFGIQGFVHHVDTHDSFSRAYIRLESAEFDYIGSSVLMPSDDVEASE